MNCLSNRNVVELVDLPDELILNIMKKVNPQVLLLCSMIDIGNNRLKELAFDRCHSIDLTFDYFRAAHKTLLRGFYSTVMPYISHNIQSLTINLHHISAIKTFVDNNCNGTLPNLKHLKVMLGAKHVKTGIPFTIAENLRKDKLRFDQVIRLTDICISLWHFEQCVHLLNQWGSQLHSFTVTIGDIYDNQPNLTSEMNSISCPNLKQVTLTMYRGFNNYEPCLSLLQRLSNVEHLTLLLAIGRNGTTPNHFIDGLVLERKIFPYMSRLRQFQFHIRSILKNASHITIDQIRQSFQKQQQSFDCVLDHFKNNYGQCQSYSLPFPGTRLDFVSNRFPLFDINNTFSNVTILTLFDDIKPFENDFFERLARTLSRLRTLEIINQLDQQEKTTVTKTNIDFAQLTTLILYDIHMDYAEQFLCQNDLSSLLELAVDKDILFTMINQNQQQTRDNCSRVGTIITSKPSYQSIDTIRNFFPRAHYVRHSKEHQYK